MSRLLQILLAALLIAPAAATPDALAQRTITLNEPVTIQAAAVTRTPDGLEGSTARIEVSVAPNGSGHVFMDTSSFTQVDMQGSAKLATRVAASITGLPREEFDYFFVVDTPSPIIGGPSAGAEMAVATVAAMMNWTVDEHAIMTGTVNLDGTVGPVGGIPEKAEAARDAGAGLFLFPQGQANATTGGGEQVHVPTYCREELDITCEAVTDVREAVAHMTGHRFPAPEPATNVTGADYREVLQPLGPELLHRANNTIANASADLDDANLDRSTESALRSRLQDARGTRDEAADAVERRRYYTGASRAFQATVAARTVVEAVEILDSDNPSLRYQSRAGEARGEIARATDAADRTPTDLTELQSVGAAQSRVLDARDRLNSSQQAWKQAEGPSQALGAISNLAFAFERTKTVHWWLRIGDAFPPGPPVNASEIRGASQDVLATARDSVAYARVLSQRSGEGSNPLVQESGQLLGSAQRAREEGFLAASIYDALQAEAWASTGISTAGLPQDVVESRRDRARDRSGAAIAEARAQGVEPLLAEAYYEFAGDFQDPLLGLAYYGLSGTIARSTSAFQAPGDGPNPSRFVGTHPDAVAPGVSSQGGQPVDVTVGLVALSFAAGTFVAVGALLGRE